MIFHANLLLSLWAEAFSSVVCLINLLPSSNLQNESPYHKLFNRYPDYSGLRVLGSLWFPSLRHQGGSKFVKKTYACVFIGYSPVHKEYRCLEPKTKRDYISSYVIFMRNFFFSNQLSWVKSLKSSCCRNFQV